MSKVLININDLNEIEEYKKIGISNFLFAIDNFSIGYKTFSLSDIPTDSYLLINRVLDTNDTELLRNMHDEIVKFKGIIYEDVAVYNIFKDDDIELIWFQNHFNTNYESINFWLEHGCSSAVIGNEITKEEIIDITNKAIKPLVLNVFGKNQIMYSRRTLLSNFNKYNNITSVNDTILKEEKTKVEFNALENEYGTVLFNNEYFNYFSILNDIDDKKIKYLLVLNKDFTVLEIKDIINGKQIGNDGFLNKKTVYKMSEYNDR